MIFARPSTVTPQKYLWYIDSDNYAYAKLEGTVIQVWKKQNGGSEELVEEYS
jgi:hypothetical protein